MQLDDALAQRRGQLGLVHVERDVRANQRAARKIASALRARDADARAPHRNRRAHAPAPPARSDSARSPSAARARRALTSSVVNRDRLLPVALLLVDAQQVAQRRARAARRLRELLKQTLGAIEQPRAEIVLGEREHRVQAMLVAERRPRHDVLVDADRALDLAAPPIEAAEREMRLDGLVVDVDHAQEHFERLVRLFVEQEARPLEIVLVQRRSGPGCAAVRRSDCGGGDAARSRSGTAPRASRRPLRRTARRSASSDRSAGIFAGGCERPRARLGQPQRATQPTALVEQLGDPVDAPEQARRADRRRKRRRARDRAASRCAGTRARRRRARRSSR